MADHPTPHRMHFLLPKSLLLLVQPGRHSPCIHGCVLMIDRGRIEIDGPSREKVFEQARRFMRVITKDRPPMIIPAVLFSPGPGRGRDGYTIIVNSDVSIVPTTIDSDISKEEPWKAMEAPPVA